MIDSAKVLVWLLAQFKLWFSVFNARSAKEQIDFIDDHIDALIEFRKDVYDRLALDDTIPTIMPSVDLAEDEGERDESDH